MHNVFAAKAVNLGGIIRRSVRGIDRVVGWDMFVSELRRNGFHAVENAGQMLIFCNQKLVRMVR